VEGGGAVVGVEFVELVGMMGFGSGVVFVTVLVVVLWYMVWYIGLSGLSSRIVVDGAKGIFKASIAAAVDVESADFDFRIFMAVFGGKIGGGVGAGGGVVDGAGGGGSSGCDGGVSDGGREGRGSVGRFRVGECVSESVGVGGGSGSGGCCGGDGGSERGRVGGGWGACIYAYGDGMITIYDWDGGGGDMVDDDSGMLGGRDWVADGGLWERL